MRKDGKWSIEDLRKLKRSMYKLHDNCAYCGKQMNAGEKVADHIIAMSLGGASYDVNNLVICCVSCNSRKGAKLYWRWVNELPDNRRATAINLFVDRFGYHPRLQPMSSGYS